MFKELVEFVTQAITILVAMALAALLCATLIIGSENKEWLQDKAAAKWQAQGFQVIDYQGYHWGLVMHGTTYGGASVYHMLKKIPDNGITYGGHVRRWGDEIHVYGLEAIDAVKPRDSL